ncbi:hypothetical protein DYB37_005251 [Aphanomyces astaci]|uniref:Tyrosyl-DNA phosphodiesterase n=1 Tax=Aphanomyces astaci TaxID=112090 RepID=A0A3R7BX48_APHAT|nr:hypothetical protein DYB35_011438 [Aphanomyces astaci]RHZ05900.1 hypothetical protein DYB37_005251 [Aphanomyces astaci]
MDRRSYATIDPTTRSLDFVLLTSANFSKAAWGAVEKGGTQLKIRSYELGVLFLPSQTTKALRLLPDDRDMMDVVRFPLPFQWPPTPYDPRTDEPWTWDLARADVDVYGLTYSVD